MTDLAAKMSKIQSTSALLATPEQLLALQRAQARTRSMSPSSALAGWPVGVGVRGGRGTLHGSIGLLDGALVG